MSLDHPAERRSTPLHQSSQPPSRRSGLAARQRRSAGRSLPCCAHRQGPLKPAAASLGETATVRRRRRIAALHRAHNTWVAVANPVPGGEELLDGRPLLCEEFKAAEVANGSTALSDECPLPESATPRAAFRQGTRKGMRHIPTPSGPPRVVGAAIGRMPSLRACRHPSPRNALRQGSAAEEFRSGPMAQNRSLERAVRPCGPDQLDAGVGRLRRIESAQPQEHS